ncbi:MAG TPA: beta-ketoacyl-[acyl-carrier-protein] synthase family protein [Steroidobacteraceae bacterium]|jgi:3-oxoacyl-[acyl-carrier-protein] synthase-1|nr:beta-ketoacyl-[acyl-carrier-protein] synthase family protein [Steroidobacteraceae bacterium]
MKPLELRAFTATSSIGRGLTATLAALRAQASGLAPCAFESVTLATYVGEVAGVDEAPLPAPLAEYECRNNRLARLGLAQDGFAEALTECVARHGRERVGVFLGTSTSGVLDTEIAYRRRDPVSGALPEGFHYRGAHNSFSVAAYARAAFGLTGPAVVVSSACSSSAKVFASAQRAIAAGVVDAALVGGVDSLCLTTLYGFHSLQLVAPGPCRPFDVARDGISIGEAAAFALLTPAADSLDADRVLLLGAGESSDAHHMSAPHPEGRGARAAMLAALSGAGCAAQDIDYVNFHGTGTPSNDAAEALAVASVLGREVPGSSTKGATGHTLGAAGALEAVICALALREGFMPGGVNTHTVDPALAVTYLRANRAAPLHRVLSNSFGFGGSNCSLVLGRAG